MSSGSRLGVKASTPLYVIKGEICLLTASLRRNTRWTSHQQEGKSDPIFRKLVALKDSLDHLPIKETLGRISGDATFFLLPFLDVIRSEEASGPLTILALSSVEKFITYEIVNEVNGAGGAVEAISDAVIHAHFVSTDSASDELVLMKILQVLHRLFVSPIGILLSNESVCELMQSCFRMCFIERANELLRKSAESALTDMIRLLFSRIHSFSTTSASSMDQRAYPKSKNNLEPKIHHSHHLPSKKGDLEDSEEPKAIGDGKESIPEIHVEGPSPPRDAVQALEGEGEDATRPTIEIPVGGSVAEEFKTKRGVKFTTESVTIEESANKDQGTTTITKVSNSRITIPYGIPCVRELLRFLISLVNPHEKQNTELMIHLGLRLLLVAIEVGLHSLSAHATLMAQVRGDLCKNLIALLSPSNTFPTSNPKDSPSGPSTLIYVLRLLFLLFESHRTRLKYQLEVFCNRISELLSEPLGAPRTWTYEQREFALDTLVSLWKLPCFVTELYLNYDTDLFSSNLFEDITKLLSKNAFPMNSAPLQANTPIINTFHTLCLDGLLSILDGIEGHCSTRLSPSSGSPGSTGGTDESNVSSVFYPDSSIEEPQSPNFGGKSEKTGEKVEESEIETEKTGNSDQKASKNGIFDSKSPNSDTKPRKSSIWNESEGRKGWVTVGGSGGGREETLLPTHEQLMAIRHKKKIFQSGSEHFNNSAKKGIEFLQNHGLLSSPLDPPEMAHFLRENPLLDKKGIGDYISSKKNGEVLKSFVGSFDWSRVRIDEALRQFLETFRLPGEAPLISHIMEVFAEHWHGSNGEFVNADAAFTLSYAIIMLNVDQHNANVRKNGNPMTLDEFRRNVKGVNGGSDFDQEMLKEIYGAIRSEEIVMPAEQTGAVRDNYLWKVLLKRGSSPQCQYLSPFADEGVFDHDLFSLAWGPIVAALSFLFDKAPPTDSAIITKTLGGFRKCATIAAHYGMSDVFDNLIISLCKFTSLLGSASNADPIASNPKATAATRAVFTLLHRHGDILREGWHNFIDILVALFRLGLLPRILTESEDFTEPSGRISIVRRSTLTPSTPRVEAGLFSSLYSYISLSADSPGSKSSMADEEEARNKSLNLILEVRPELLLSESKFLQLDSLQELIKSLIYASPVPESPKRKDYDEDATVFVLEVLLKITIHNRDRALSFWDPVRDHLFNLIIASSHMDTPFLLERATVGLLRVSLRLMRKEDLCPIVLQSLRILLYLRPAAIIQLSTQLSFGLHEILKTTAANIHMAEEWSVIFSLLEYIGAGKVPPTLQNVFNSAQKPVLETGAVSEPEMSGSRGLHEGLGVNRGLSISSSGLSQGLGGPIGYSSGSDRGYTSDSELEIKSTSADRGGGVSPAQSWILLSQDDQQMATTPPQQPPQLMVQQNQTGTSIEHPPIRPQFLATPLPGPQGQPGPLQPLQGQLQAPNQVQGQSQIPPERQLFYPDPKSLLKSTETLTFLVRDAAHITPDNFTLCVASIRSFVEASTHKSKLGGPPGGGQWAPGGKKKRHSVRRAPNQANSAPPPRSKSFTSSSQMREGYDADESDSEDGGASTSCQVCIQLLDLLHTLHTRAASIFQWWERENKEIRASGENSLWALGWRPLLQTIVILCSDSRRLVRTTALTYLQRALLVHDLQQLSPPEWFSCFHEVLFPLMARLLQPIAPDDLPGMEESRMRAVTLLCKVFLQHLSPLLQLEGFCPLWLGILDFLERYMRHTERSELLLEAIPESLKNLLLVMETAGIFHTAEGYTKLWALTWDKIDGFVPGLRAELMRAVPPPHSGGPGGASGGPGVASGGAQGPGGASGGQGGASGVPSGAPGGPTGAPGASKDAPEPLGGGVGGPQGQEVVEEGSKGVPIPRERSQPASPLSTSPGKDYTSISFDEDGVNGDGVLLAGVPNVKQDGEDEGVHS